MTRVVLHGRPMWLKRRRRATTLLLGCANVFFRLAHSPMRTIVPVDQWQQRELDSFRLLHGDQFDSLLPEPRTVAAEELPGINLTIPLDDGTITPRMTAAAGRELRRAHGIVWAPLGSLWSHGDSHLGNFIYEPECDRARIIDFEVQHDPALPAGSRHLDDVLVFLQDMAGRIHATKWLSCAAAFLDAYGQPYLYRKLLPMLEVPVGVPRIWWAIRTGFMGPEEWSRRVRELVATFKD